MTKTLTEQYKNKELSGWYYVKAKDGSINHWLLFIDSIEFDKDGDVEEVLAPVPSYDEYKELVRKSDELEKRLEVSEKEHYRALEQLRIATAALKDMPEMSRAQSALREMEGVK